MHTAIDFRTQDEHEQREETALEFSVDEEMAARIRINTRSWRQRNGLEPKSDEATR